MSLYVYPRLDLTVVVRICKPSYAFEEAYNTLSLHQPDLVYQSIRNTTLSRSSPSSHKSASNLYQLSNAIMATADEQMAAIGAETINRVVKCSPLAYYDILGLEAESVACGENEVKKAYRKISILVHPDNNKDNEDAKKAFRMVKTAYKNLKDPEKKAKFNTEHCLKPIEPENPAMTLNPTDHVETCKPDGNEKKASKKAEGLANAPPVKGKSEDWDNNKTGNKRKHAQHMKKAKKPTKTANQPSSRVPTATDPTKELDRKKKLRRDESKVTGFNVLSRKEECP